MQITGRILSKNDAQLLLNLFRMNLRDRYLGSKFGTFWAVLNPLLLMLVYTFVFGFVFKAKIPGSEASLDYVVWLISGLGIWFAMNEAIINATHSLTASAGLIKNLSFRTELLPVAAASTGIAPVLVSVFLSIILMLITGATLSWHIILVIVVIPLGLGLGAAIGLFTSVINVFSRDFGHGLPTFLLMVMFFTPIFYPIDSLPSVVKKITFLNPFYQIVDAFRKVLLENSLPNFAGLAYVILVIIVLFLIGGVFFRRMKTHCVNRL